MFINLPLGTTSWVYGTLPLEEVLPCMSALGLSWLELEWTPNTSELFGLRQLLDTYEIKLAALLPPPVDLTHPDAIQRQIALHTLEQVIEQARLLDVPLVICRSGTNPSVDSHTYARLVESLKHLTAFAPKQRLAFDLLNRYESSQINTVEDGLSLLETVNAPNLGLSMGAFHMNIEEQDGAGALVKAGQHLWHYRVADSTRGAIGTGHIKLGAHVWALQDEINYQGVVVLEPMLQGGKRPFDKETRTHIDEALRISQSWF